MRPIHTFQMLAVIAGLAAATSATGVTPLAGSEFRQMCAAYAAQPYSDQGALCSMYIHGFLGGAHASGKARDSKTSKGEPRSGFMDRATRTRLGRPIDRYGNYFSAGYCLPAGESLSAVVGAVLEHLESKKADESETANQLVIAALKKQYPCTAQ